MTLGACSTSNHLAPVVDVSSFKSIPRSGLYKVRKGDTLYSIAWRYGFDYQELAKKNLISSPYDIHTGQKIYFKNKPEVLTKPSKNKIVATSKPVAKPKNWNREPAYKISKWSWPTRGKVVKRFSKSNNGIGIRARSNQAVFAAAPGKVVYAGNGLRGYGNLIILKHNRRYLSAYAHTKNLKVKEGEWVAKGQKIASIGGKGKNKNTLHFEIRKLGSPVNPLKLLR